MPRSRHPLRTLTALTLTAALLAACGGGGSDSPAANPPPTGSGLPPPSPSPAPAPGPSPAPAPSPTPAPSPAPAVTAVGVPLGPVAASAEIGPAGGRLDAPDQGLAVIVPPGAFDRVRTVAIQPIKNEAPGARGPAWRITPEGLNTPVPITVEWSPNAAERNGAKHLRIATQGADGVWRSARSTTQTAGVLRTHTRHFSDWSLVAGVQLRPGQADVAINQSQELTVMICGRAHDPAQAEYDVHFACSPDGAGALATNAWAVNGGTGGNATVGTLSGADDLGPARRRYRAPAAVPAPNPVAVSVRYDDPFDDITGPVDLVANITVFDPSQGCDWIKSVKRLDATVEQDYRWTGRDGQAAQRFDFVSRVKGTLVQVEPSPVGSVWFSGSFDQGAVSVRHQLQQFSDGSEITVTANDAPKADPAIPGVHLFVDLATCTFRYVATVMVAARHVGKHQGVEYLLEDKWADLSFTLADVPMAGRRSFDQQRLLPVYTGPRPSTDIAILSGGAHHEFELPSGEARIRWTLAPQ
jgi:hypothetical protein